MKSALLFLLTLFTFVSCESTPSMKAKDSLSLSELSAEIKQEDAKKIVAYLASEKMAGRMTGSPEEILYTQTIADLFKGMGLEAYGTNGTYFQNFDFVSKVVLGKHNGIVLKHDKQVLKPVLNKDWVPLAFSQKGSMKYGEIAFAGYGIVAPGDKNAKAYNSYKGLNVKGKWAMIFRYLPEDISDERKRHLQPYAKLYTKVTAAKLQGAKGVILVSGPNSGVKSDLISFGNDDLKTTGPLPVISITDDLARKLLGSGHDLKDLQTKLDRGQRVGKVRMTKHKLAGHISIEQESAKGRNTLGFLKVPGAKKTIIIGAHGDHIGKGKSSSSLMKSTDTTDIHFGADDNASGTAGVIELAHYYSEMAKKDPKSLKYNMLFIIWSGEEIGILGSAHFRMNNPITNRKRKRALNKDFAMYLNLDMIGRLKKEVSVQGVGSIKGWDKLIKKVSKGNSTPMVTTIDPYLPTDAMAMYMGNLPVLNFFTGVHTDYHSPRDTMERLNYPGIEKITKLVTDFTKEISMAKSSPKFVKVERKHNSKMSKRTFRASLGTIPDYSQKKGAGVAISGVVKNGAADRAGLKGGDVMIQISKFKLNNIHDFVAALQTLKPGKKTTVTVKRDGKTVTLPIIPLSKE